MGCNMKEEKQKYFNSAISTDALIFSVDSRENENTKKLPKKYLSILLVKRVKEPFKDRWVLPGGFLENGELADDANKRIVKKETNLENLYTKQIYTFTGLRDPRGLVASIAYMTLIDKSKLKNTLSEDACWFDIDIHEDDEKVKINLANGKETFSINYTKSRVSEKTSDFIYKCTDDILGFDHEDILIKGIETLRKEIELTDLIFDLMPTLFTVGELKQVYELILGKKLINSAFRRVIAKKIVQTDKQVKTGGHRPSNLYKYKR